jgi:hypothetical protein
MLAQCPTLLRHIMRHHGGTHALATNRGDLLLARLLLLGRPADEGVGLVVFWPALFFLAGDDQKEALARLKGEYEALQAAAIRKDCGFAEALQSAG